jgi:hypothetical protein
VTVLSLEQRCLKEGVGHVSSYDTAEIIESVKKPGETGTCALSTRLAIQDDSG